MWARHGRSRGGNDNDGGGECLTFLLVNGNFETGFLFCFCLFVKVVCGPALHNPNKQWPIDRIM